MSKHVFGFERWEQWVTDKATALLEAGRTGSLRRVLCSRSVPRTVLSCPFYGVTPIRRFRDDDVRRPGIGVGRKPRSNSSPTRRGRRCSIRADAKPRLASSGLTPATIGPGAVRSRPASPMSTSPTANMNGQSRIWPALPESSRSMAMAAPRGHREIFPKSYAKRRGGSRLVDFVGLRALSDQSASYPVAAK